MSVFRCEWLSHRIVVLHLKWSVSRGVVVVVAAVACDIYAYFGLLLSSVCGKLFTNTKSIPCYRNDLDK